MTNPQPTVDLKLTYTADPTTGKLVADFALAPDGDLAVVAGIDKVGQNVERYLHVARGSYPFDPSFGNELVKQIGQPDSDTVETFKKMLTSAEEWILAHQGTNGLLASQEELSSLIYKSTSYTPSEQDARFAELTFTVAVKAGISKDFSTPFPLRHNVK